MITRAAIEIGRFDAPLWSLQIVEKSLAGSTVGNVTCVDLSMLSKKGTFGVLQGSLDSMMHGSFPLHCSGVKHSLGLHARTEGKNSIYKRRKLAKRCAAPVAEGQEAGPTGRPGPPQAAPQRSSNSGQKGLRVCLPPSVQDLACILSVGLFGIQSVILYKLNSWELLAAGEDREAWRRGMGRGCRCGQGR